MQLIVFIRMHKHKVKLSAVLFTVAEWTATFAMAMKKLNITCKSSTEKACQIQK